MRPTIGITARFRKAIRSHCIHEGYVDQVEQAGGVPLVIPFGDVSLCEPVLSLLDGLMLTGGQDIDPTYAAETPRRSGDDYDPARDAFELRLATAALEACMPILGICRGCQILHVATGNRLIPHIPDVNGGRVQHRISLSEPSRHKVTLAADSKVGCAYDEQSILVTSYHHQGLVMHGDTDRAWRTTAYSDDSLVEAIEFLGNSWTVGVMWHPELPADGSQDRLDPLISAFVSAAVVS